MKAAEKGIQCVNQKALLSKYAAEHGFCNTMFFIYQRLCKQKEMGGGRRSGKCGAENLWPVHCGQRPHADLKNPEGRQGVDRHRL